MQTFPQACSPLPLSLEMCCSLYLGHAFWTATSLAPLSSKHHLTLTLNSLFLCQGQSLPHLRAVLTLPDLLAQLSPPILEFYSRAPAETPGQAALTNTRSIFLPAPVLGRPLGARLVSPSPTSTCPWYLSLCPLALCSSSFWGSRPFLHLPFVLEKIVSTNFLFYKMYLNKN